MNIKKYFAIVLLAGSINLPINAAALPDYYPGMLSVTGKLERLSTNDDTIVIEDMKLRLKGRIIVHTPDTEYGTLNLLHEGMRVGVNPDRKGNIHEIWVLPADFKINASALPLAK